MCLWWRWCPHESLGRGTGQGKTSERNQVLTLEIVFGIDLVISSNCSKRRKLEDLDYHEKREGLSIGQAELEEEADYCSVVR